METLEQHIFRVGPFSVKLKTDITAINHWVKVLYQDFPKQEATLDFFDFDICIKPPSLLRRFLHPQAQFYFNEHAPFMPLPLGQAMPMFEWGLNWCIANLTNQFLHFHAAGLAKNDTLIIFPAPPGSGKSTLTAALMLHGWQLYSDELIMVEPETLDVNALSRPINLKNDSIDLITNTFSKSVMSDKFHDTSKGTIGLLKPTKQSVENIYKKRKVTHIVFPKYVPGSKLITKNYDKAEIVMDLISNSFNYLLLGKAGFDAVCNLVNNSECFSMSYSQFDDALNYFDSLAN